MVDPLALYNLLSYASRRDVPSLRPTTCSRNSRTRSSRRVIGDTHSQMSATRSPAARTSRTKPRVAGDRPPQNSIAAERVHRIARIAHGMCSRSIHRLILIRVWNLVAMPALQEREEQRGKHRRAGDRGVLGQALAHRRRDEAWDLGVRVHRHPLVGVANGRIAEALEHDIAIGGQIDRAREQDKESRRR